MTDDYESFGFSAEATEDLPKRPPPPRRALTIIAPPPKVPATAESSSKGTKLLTVAAVINALVCLALGGLVVHLKMDLGGESVALKDFFAFT